MSNSIAPGSSADVNVKVTALTTNSNVPAQYKTIILKKNLVNEVNTLTQEMMSAQNTKYVIKYDFTLGEDITVPGGCVLEFDGGSISGTYTLTGTNTYINSEKTCIKNDVIIAGTWANEIVYTRWFNFVSSNNGVTDNVHQFKQLQKVINGTNGCKVEFEPGYYQTSIQKNTPTGTYIIDGQSYPQWQPNTTYIKDTEIVLNAINIPYVDINLNGSTIKLINVVNPRSVVIQTTNVDNAYLHDGVLIGMAGSSFPYSSYANLVRDIWSVSNDYEWGYGIYQCGGFLIVNNVNMQYFTGDGIAVGSGKWLESDSVVNCPAKGYNVQNCKISYCGRNGITLHSSNEGTLFNCCIHNIGSDAGNKERGTDGVMGFNPRAGIDVEFEDGLGLKPVMKWDSLVIKDCARHSFGFANSISSMKQFEANNLYCIGFPIFNNLNADDIAIVKNSYFHTDPNEDGSLYGSGALFKDCKFDIASSISIGSHTFDGCEFMDVVDSGSTINQLFIQGVHPGIIRNCHFMLKHSSYFSSKNLVDCAIDLYGDSKTLYLGGANVVRCKIEAFGTDTYNWNIGVGNNVGDISISDSTIKNLKGIGGSVSGYSFDLSDYNMTLDTVNVLGNIVINIRDKKLNVKNSNIQDIFISGYQTGTNTEFYLENSRISINGHNGQISPVLYKTIIDTMPNNISSLMTAYGCVFKSIAETSYQGGGKGNIFVL